MSNGLHNEAATSSLHGQTPSEPLPDVSLELQTSPELEAVAGLYSALRAAQLRPDDPETKQTVALAWGDVYLRMPPLVGVTLDQPAEPPRDAAAVKQIGFEVMDIDRGMRGPAGRLLALSLATNHPGGHPIGETQAAAFNRVGQLATTIGEQVGRHMLNRLRPDTQKS